MKRKLLAALIVCALLLSSCQYIVVEDEGQTQVRLGGAMAETAGGYLGLGSRDAEGEHAVADLQRKLIALDFLSGEPDGVFGSDTEEALVALQWQYGLEETGVLDEATQAALAAEGEASAEYKPEAEPDEAEALVSKGSRDENGAHAVADLQARLIDLNYLEGKADGIFGRDTEAALIAFQTQNGLEETGALDEATQAALAAGGVPNPGEAVNATAPLSKGSRDADREHAVADLQASLIALNYLAGKADGIFGADTEAALLLFQRVNGLEETGVLDKATKAAFRAGGTANPGDVVNPPPPLGKGSKDEDGEHAVADLQARLMDMNYLGGTADGIFGKGTEAALIDFQRLNGLEETGVLDAPTKAALASPDAVARPLALGVSGIHVKEVQEPLKVYGFYFGLVDGNFDENLDLAVKAFQQYQYDQGLLAPEPEPEATAEPELPDEPELLPSPAGGQNLMGAMLQGVAGVIEAAEAEETASEADPEAGETAGDEAPETADADEASGADAEAGETAYEPDGVVDKALMAMLTDGSFQVFREELSRGSKGREVERLQYRLTDLDYLMDTIDGQFGPNTQEALTYFQKRNKLEETGVADEATQRALFNPRAVKSDLANNMYLLKVSVDQQRVYAYRWANGGYNKLVRTMVCSTGSVSSPTPLGTYRAVGPSGCWYYFEKYKCWAQYAFRIDGPYLFHSVIYSAKDENSVRWGTVGALGYRASHGCVRLSVEDAKWIYENCPRGTTVKVY